MRKANRRNDCLYEQFHAVPSPNEPVTVPNFITRFMAALERWLTERSHVAHRSPHISPAARSLDYDAYIRANVHDSRL